jgi:hypothetical protein
MMPPIHPRLRMAKVRATRISEKAIQSQIVQLIRSVSGRVWVLGTHRPRGSRCPSCGTFVAEHQGTCQTPGVSDLIAVLPTHPGASDLVFIEVKAVDGRLSDAQADFRAAMVAAGIAYIVGGFDDVLRVCVDRGLVRAENVPHYRREQGQ